MKKIKNAIMSEIEAIVSADFELLALGKLLSNQQLLLPNMRFHEAGFKIFSQFDDDGLIQYLIKHIEIENEIFIEFGVQDYSESNTRFLMMNNNWQGFVMDGSSKNMDELKKQPYFWQYSLSAQAVFIDKDNINDLIAGAGFQNIGILSIDIDGNDAHILECMDLTIINPAIIIIEYNSLFGIERAISVPYDKHFVRTEKHYSNQYYGASLKALSHIASKKGYALIGCNNFGNNAYFVRKDLLNGKVYEKAVEDAYVVCKFREGRDQNGELALLSGNARLDSIKGLTVVNVMSGEEEIV